MRILVTNDDGVFAPALPRLVKWAEKLGEVVTIAPKVEQSGKSHAIDFFSPLEIKKVTLEGGYPAYSVESTPADCVRFGVLGLKLDFDLVISGINRGYNLGRDTVYSGTAGAIFEAARLGIKGIALSTDTHTFDPAFEALDSLQCFFEEHRLLEESDLYNINIPETVEGIRITRLGGIYYTDEFLPQGNDIYLQVGHPVEYGTSDTTVDIDCINQNLISVTPLTFERSNLPVFERLQYLNER